MAIDMSQFQEIFIEESYESLAEMEAGLLQLDLSSPDAETINNIFRAAHSIKGGAGTFNFPEISEFTHVQESLLDMVRAHTRGLNREMVDVFLECVDCVRGMLEASRQDSDYDDARISDLKIRLQRFLVSDNQAPEPTISTASESAEIEDINKSLWTVCFKPHEHMLITGNDPFRLLRELRTLGHCEIQPDLNRLPEFSSIDPEKSYLGWVITLKSDCREEQIREIFDWVDGDCALTIDRQQTEEVDVLIGSEAVATESSEQNDDPIPQHALNEGSAKPEHTQDIRKVEDIVLATNESSSIRVDIEKIEHLINLVGELVITQSALSQYSRELSQFEHFEVGLQQLSNNIQELQEQSMKIRMLPIDFVFQRLPRLIRDLSATLEKKVNYELVGKHTEVDKTVLEKISDPLVHIIRNAIDHGIEPPEERQEAGKSAEALIKISAEHQSGNIVITIRDDGRGLNVEKIRNRAVEQNLIAEGELLSTNQVQNLIFSPGFSTAEVVSDVSGRGVGLDVVKQNIKSLGGDVSVVSSPSEGSEFKITLPLTMAILDGQLVRIRNEVFVVPMVNIEKSVRLEEENHNIMPGGRELYRFEEEYVPILRLSHLYEETGEHDREGILVVLNTDQKAAIMVDEVLGQQQVVIRSLEANFHRVETIAGATILGDGTVALILDSNEIVQKAYQQIDSTILETAS